MFAIDDVIDNIWQIRQRVGKGTFCELFVGCNIHTKQIAAIKIKNTGIEGQILKWEAEVLKNLNGCDSFPRFIQLGHTNGYNYLVMDLFGGEDMGKLRNRLRTSTNAGNPYVYTKSL